MRRTEQRRAAVIAAYQHDLTAGRSSDTLGRTPDCSRARSRMRRLSSLPSSTS